MTNLNIVVLITILSHIFYLHLVLQGLHIVDDFLQHKCLVCNLISQPHTVYMYISVTQKILIINSEISCTPRNQTRGKKILLNQTKGNVMYCCSIPQQPDSI